ncbi:MAG: hypothetical protein [Arizlama microvirus]|nr:MAG: hypothetical protein [Arizlama microvirus]
MSIKKAVVKRVKDWVAKFDEEGREIPDPTPHSLAVGFRKPETIDEKILRLVKSREMQRDLEAQGYETFEDAEDFDVGDDFDPQTPYELVFDPGLGRDVTRAEKAFLDSSRNQFVPPVPSMKEERPVKRPSSKKSAEQAPAAEQHNVNSVEADI